MKNVKIHYSVFGYSVFLAALISVIPLSAVHATSVVPSSPEEAPSPSVSDLPPAPEISTPPQPSAIAPVETEAPAVVTPSQPQIATPAPASATTGQPAVSGIIPPTTSAPTPAQEGLSPGLTPVPGDDAGSLSGTNVMGASGAPVRHSGTYYDSDAIVPDADLQASGATGPRKVDPALEPGQTFVVVKNTGSANSIEAQYVAATRALKLARYAAAMEMFEKLYKKSRKDPRILMGLAVAQQGAGFKESAAATYGELLDVQPNNADAIINLMGIMKDQYPSVTLQRLTELRNKYPMNAGVPAQMGLTNAEMKNYDDAVRNFELAASLDPNNPSHIYNMAIIVDRKGDAKKAVKLYEQALQMDASGGETVNGLPREQIYDRLVVLRRKI